MVSWFLRLKARLRIHFYDLKRTKKNPKSERPDPLPIEQSFDRFVERFGGTKISDLISDQANMPLNADYIFRDHNVVAELKTLEVLSV